MKAFNGWQALYRWIPREKNQDGVTQYISGVTCGPSWPSTELDKGARRHRLPRWLSGKRICQPMQETQDKQFDPRVGKRR